VLLATAACAGDSPSTDDVKLSLDGVTIVDEDASGLPFADMSKDEMSRFNHGDSQFEHNYFDAEGLGPVFIRSSCGKCHQGDGRGPGSVRKMVMVGADGAPLADQSELNYGHTVRPQTSGKAARGIEPPDDTTGMLITVRMPPAVFGRGYLEAVEDEEIQRVEAEQARRDDGVSGRINWVTYASQPNPDSTFDSHQPGDTLIGRFGLKARIGTLDDFAADAFQGDMGITSDLRPDELPNPDSVDDDKAGVDISADVVNSVADYMRVLRIPARKSSTDERGAALFEQTQCNVCHVPTLHTREDYPIAKIAGVDAPIYTDLLLHDMGPDFADGLQDYGANGSEWRTPPLMGLRFFQYYLHDGRAHSVEEAIELHGGEGSEAKASVDSFRALDDDSRAELVKFVSGL
jgi:CxxC motif-containing protein (DUF1111 family)